jgi:hypothetical protein
MFVLSSRAFPSSPLRINPWLEGRMMIHHLSLSLFLSLSLSISLSLGTIRISKSKCHITFHPIGKESERARGKQTLIITICSIKRKENFFFSLFFFRVLKRARVFLAREQKNSGKKFFFLLNMKFCFMKHLFYTALEETMSVARVKQLLTSGGSSLF